MTQTLIERLEELGKTAVWISESGDGGYIRLPDLRAIIEEYKATEQAPFGYFKAEPFGWTDCAETDEGAIALYERPQLADESVKVPEGYALVPIEPTEAMMMAGDDIADIHNEYGENLHIKNTDAVYKAMIDEAMKAEREATKA